MSWRDGTVKRERLAAFVDLILEKGINTSEAEAEAEEKKAWLFMPLPGATAKDASRRDRDLVMGFLTL